MRLHARLNRLEAGFPECGAQVLRLVSAGDELTEADRCPRCGEWHVLVIHEEIVQGGPDVLGSGIDPNGI